MKIDRFNVQACCGKTSIIFKTDQPLSIKHIEGLISNGFKEHAHFTKAGIMYVDNSDFILTGPLGSDRLQVKCVSVNCEKEPQKLNDLEDLLLQLG